MKKNLSCELNNRKHLTIRRISENQKFPLIIQQLTSGRRICLEKCLLFQYLLVRPFQTTTLQYFSIPIGYMGRFHVGTIDDDDRANFEQLPLIGTIEELCEYPSSTTFQLMSRLNAFKLTNNSSFEIAKEEPVVLKEFTRIRDVEWGNIRYEEKFRFNRNNLCQSFFFYLLPFIRPFNEETLIRLHHSEHGVVYLRRDQSVVNCIKCSNIDELDKQLPQSTTNLKKILEKGDNNLIIKPVTESKRTSETYQLLDFIEDKIAVGYYLDNDEMEMEGNDEKRIQSNCYLLPFIPQPSGIYLTYFKPPNQLEKEKFLRCRSNSPLSSMDFIETDSFSTNSFSNRLKVICKYLRNDMLCEKKNVTSNENANEINRIIYIEYQKSLNILLTTIQRIFWHEPLKSLILTDSRHRMIRTDLRIDHQSSSNFSSTNNININEKNNNNNKIDKNDNNNEINEKINVINIMNNRNDNHNDDDEEEEEDGNG
ncbi:hypothetical protein SNEBB_006764 [Seison nebaliae]|nr:hypothetical protein SNEBB_006764 [Seison nebaliae]